MRGELIIEANIRENVFMEGMLNQNYSGYDIEVMFFVYALVHGWNIDKIGYYSKLLGMVIR